MKPNGAYLRKINKNYKSLARINKKKRSHIINIRNEKWDITTDPKHIKRIQKDPTDIKRT